MNKRVNRLAIPAFRWILVVLWGGIIFYLSSKPLTDYPQLVPDYVAHLFEYSVLALLLWRALHYDRQTSFSLSILVIALTSFYGLTDETHQIFVPTRTFSPIDLAVDTLAAILITLILLTLSKVFRFS